MIRIFLHWVKPLNEGIIEIKHVLDYHIMQALISILPSSVGFTLYSNVHFILNGNYIQVYQINTTKDCYVSLRAFHFTLSM